MGSADAAVHQSGFGVRSASRSVLPAIWDKRSAAKSFMICRGPRHRFRRGPGSEQTETGPRRSGRSETGGTASPSRHLSRSAARPAGDPSSSDHSFLTKSAGASTVKKAGTGGESGVLPLRSLMKGFTQILRSAENKIRKGARPAGNIHRAPASVYDVDGSAVLDVCLSSLLCKTSSWLLEWPFCLPLKRSRRPAVCGSRDSSYSSSSICGPHRSPYCSGTGPEPDLIFISDRVGLPTRTSACPSTVGSCLEVRLPPVCRQIRSG